MKIAAAQTRPFKGDIPANIGQHIRFAETAAAHGCDIIVFPELSLTGYEPQLASQLACHSADSRFKDLRQVCRDNTIIIAAGLPLRESSALTISMILFHPAKETEIYSKQYIHPDEEAYFTPGNSTGLLEINGLTIAPAICYELSVPTHALKAFEKGAQLYMVSAAKTYDGMGKAHARLSEIAATYSVPVIVSNSVGPCDNFISAGRSAVWDNHGQLLNQLDVMHEGLLLFDSVSQHMAIVDI